MKYKTIPLYQKGGKISDKDLIDQVKKKGFASLSKEDLARAKLLMNIQSKTKVDLTGAFDNDYDAYEPTKAELAKLEQDTKVAQELQRQKEVRRVGEQSLSDPYAKTASGLLNAAGEAAAIVPSIPGAIYQGDLSKALPTFLQDKINPGNYGNNKQSTPASTFIPGYDEWSENHPYLSTGLDLATGAGTAKLAGKFDKFANNMLGKGVGKVDNEIDTSILGNNKNVNKDWRDELRYDLSLNQRMKNYVDDRVDMINNDRFTIKKRTTEFVNTDEPHSIVIKDKNKSGSLEALYDNKSNTWGVNVGFPNNSILAGRAYNVFNEQLPPFPKILEKTSLSLDSIKNINKLNKNKKDWDVIPKGYIDLNTFAVNDKLLSDLVSDYGIPSKYVNETVDRINANLDFPDNRKAVNRDGIIKVPNYQLNRKYSFGGVVPIGAIGTTGYNQDQTPNYQIGGPLLSGIIPSTLNHYAQNYPVTTQYGSKPFKDIKDIEGLYGFEQAKKNVLNYTSSPQYRVRLQNEIDKSNYGEGRMKPTVDQLQQDRVAILNTIPTKHYRDTNYYHKQPSLTKLGDEAWEDLYNNSTLGEVNIGPSGYKINDNNEKVYNPKTGAAAYNPAFGREYADKYFSRLGYILPSAEKIGKEVGNEEFAHVTQDSTQYKSPLDYTYEIDQYGNKVKLDRNITPYAHKLISDIAYKGNWDTKSALEKEYLSRPHEVDAKIKAGKVNLLDEGVMKPGDQFKKKHFNWMLNNPTMIDGHVLKYMTGKENPHVELKKNPKLKKEVFNKFKTLHNELADTGENDIPIARNGMKVPRIIKPSNISKPNGRPVSNYYKGNVMQDGGVAKGNAIDLLKEKYALDNERQMDQLNIPANHRIDTTTPLTQQQKEEINRQVEARLYNIENGTQWLDSKVKSINKNINLTNDMEYLKTANIPIMTNNPGPKYQSGGPLYTVNKDGKLNVGDSYTMPAVTVRPDNSAQQLLLNNINKPMVKRLFNKNAPTIILPGETEPSTHMMQWGEVGEDRNKPEGYVVAPSLIQGSNGKLRYAERGETNRVDDIYLPANKYSKDYANWFSEKGYKQATNDLQPWFGGNRFEEYQSGGRLKMPILDTQIQNTTQPSFNYNGLKNEPFKLQSGGNVASNEREMAAGLNAGINQFNFPTKGLKKMTMTPESGNITDPVIMEGYTDGSLSDRKIAQPGQSNININADTIIEKPDLTYIDDFNEAYDHADKKKYPIFVWKNGEYPLKQHRKNK